MTRAISDDLRERIVARYLQEGESYDSVAEHFQVGRATVNRVVNRFRRTGSVSPSPRGGGNPPWISTDELPRLRAMVAEKPDRTARAGVVHAIRSGAFALEHGARVGSGRLVDQKKSFSASEQERPDVEARRQAFWGEVALLSRKRLIFVHESGCNTAMTPRYARAPIGERAQASRPVNRGKNISIVGAVRLRGVVATRAFEGAINVTKFLDFLERDLLPYTRKGDVVVMDNLSVHKDPKVIELISRAGVRVLFLPPYSPEFNPIELYWSSFKSTLRRFEARSRQELLAAINATVDMLQLNFRRLFRHAGYA